MREHKYRAWDIDAELWRYFTLEDALAGKLNGFDLVNFCEYTGLEDKNGKEVYEGDIIAREVKINHGEVRTAQQIFEIIWNDEYTEFSPRDSGGWKPVLKFVIDSGAEVIDNVHENPELFGHAQDA